MKKIIHTLFVLAVCVSCGSSYDIKGSSNLSTLDGRMLYLTVLKDNDFKRLDSCDVVHGQFSFSGSFDTVRLASIFMDNESLLPLVLESGDITITIDDTQQTVSGTPLNEELYRFIGKHNQLKSQLAELVHEHDQAIMNGENMTVVNAYLAKQEAKLTAVGDSLLTAFVTENFDNVLGPGVFFMVTAGDRYPQLSPWVEDIMSKATSKFKNDAYVKDYYEKAVDNEAILNGMKASQIESATTPSTAPTPDELAKPVEEQ